MILLLTLSWGMSVPAPNGAQGIALLDLTGPVPTSQQSLRMPGSYGGAVEGVGITGPPRYRLALDATISDVRHADTGVTRSLVVELILRNTGNVPFYLPVSRNSVDAHKDGNKGRRTFLFLLRLVPAGPRPLDEEVIASTVSAERVSDSWLLLQPQQSIRVLLPVDLIRVRQSAAAGLKEVGIRVVCEEWRLEDDRYYIKSQSEEVVSDIARIKIQPATSHRVR